MRKMIIKLIHWLLRKLNNDVVVFIIPPEVLKLMTISKQLCMLHDNSQSGEWRRHQVLAQLIKYYGAKERDAALAIELTVRHI